MKKAKLIISEMLSNAMYIGSIFMSKPT